MVAALTEFTKEGQGCVSRFL